MEMFARMAVHRAVSRGATITPRSALFLRRTTRAPDAGANVGPVERRFSLSLSLSLVADKNSWPVSSRVYCRKFLLSCCTNLSGYSCHAFVPRSSKGSISDKSLRIDARDVLEDFHRLFVSDPPDDQPIINTSIVARNLCFCGTRNLLFVEY